MKRTVAALLVEATIVFLDPFATLDGCSTCLLLGLLLFVGGHIVRWTPELSTVGLRLGFAAALFHTGIASYTALPNSPEQWLTVLLRSLVVAGFTTSIAWILLPATAFAYAHTIAKPIEGIRRIRQRLRCRREERALKHKEQERQQREALDWERQAPLREQQRRLDVARRLAAAEAQARRTKAREACELAFSLHGPDICDRFTRADMERFVATYMNDSQPPEDVERGAIELQKVIDAHKQFIAPSPEKLTISKLSDWYLSERRHIEGLEVDDEMKETHLAHLDARYFELSQSILEHAKP